MSMNWNLLCHVLAIGFAGALGTVARYGVSHGATAVFGEAYPWGTFLVNVVGCFAFGLVSGFVAFGLCPKAWEEVILTGFIGGFTTFSAFAFENHKFLTNGHWDTLALHVGGNVFFGVIAVLAGLFAIGWLLGFQGVALAKG